MAGRSEAVQDVAKYAGTHRPFRWVYRASGCTIRSPSAVRPLNIAPFGIFHLTVQRPATFSCRADDAKPHILDEQRATQLGEDLSPRDGSMINVTLVRSCVRMASTEWRHPSSGVPAQFNVEETVDGSLIKILWARAAQFRECHTFFQAMPVPLFEREDLPHRSRAISMRLPSLYVGPLAKEEEERTAVWAVRASGWRG